MTIKLTQFIQRVKFLNNAFLIAFNLHRKLAHIPGIKIFPKILFSFLILILTSKNFLELHREIMREEHMTNHIPCILTSYCHFGDDIVLIGCQTILISLPFCIFCCIIGRLWFLHKYILSEVVIRRTDEGIIYFIKHTNQCRGVIIFEIILIHHNIHAIRILQIEKHLFHIPHHKGNISDASLQKLSYLTFNQDFPLNLQEALWLFIREGSKAG